MSETTTPISKKKGSLADFKFREIYWNEKAVQSLVGCKIVKAEYISVEEARDIGWYSRPVAFYVVNDKNEGFWIHPQRDDEGNDGGALAVHDDILPTLTNE